MAHSFKTETERCAFTLLRLKTYLASKTVSDLPTNRETQAVSRGVELFALRIASPKKRFEDVWLILFSYPDTFICHFESYIKLSRILFIDRIIATYAHTLVLV